MGLMDVEVEWEGGPAMGSEVATVDDQQGVLTWWCAGSRMLRLFVSETGIAKWEERTEAGEIVTGSDAGASFSDFVERFSMLHHAAHREDPDSILNTAEKMLKQMMRDGWRP